MKIKNVVVLFFLFLFIFEVPIKANSDEKKQKGIILVDPGHGGIDGGARSKNGTIEKEINLSISKKLKSQLEESGYTVYMTREEDLQLDSKKVKDLNARCKMKKDTKCDIFISIHQNMFPQASCYGAQVWYSSNDCSKILAEGIQSSLREVIDDNNKRIPKAAKDQYRILRDGYEGACVLVECGFLSNYKEEEKLKKDEYQGKIAEGITNAVNIYFENKNS
ncbi:MULTISPECIES: N-acetylmuramoyl-L-alanine amidase CwlD [Clostridium]|uniref:Germination-specific N-acetylmuramoyl-L-alanine amidase CwlD n=1 Tax=Clostridium saccharoperbutylacetonicum N1-4(HMT) TaxID=931276 RepID=M1MC77_9CLOT|nr:MULTISPECIES: N-acetylmuramoyl-L-alanine amidase CwlD [Clostridium]AGF54043.1 germination-specific N-acetylmuramoyl-L-alanine amidase CwlD [Clostridium saccharoperbutylacetonicum N1-4(HMT)]AQR92947.1 N-acetylmuramoyl-L-alanine amidase AmiC precursor [Clostridium saccharoperbutylacetonicum]NRT59444.1 N-acetylmuramoyl-L-alanine amidase [Clostridium saccharoperbutylacetonicum]NSB28636.1 N-acetylmuramoyl-L-alanine amidase [Clostridium saccharoperbutylacetonicum]NSB34358.1 N-acetylmuramoyl-L-ala